MLQVSLTKQDSQAPSVLCLGAHCDDIEIGCGGTLLTLMEQYPNCELVWIVFSAAGSRAAEVQTAASVIFDGNPNARLHLLEFTDGYLPYEGVAVKKALQKLAAGLHPDIVLTHSQADGHQDHRLVSEITYNVFRNHLVLEYEIPKYDGDLGQPNVYVPLAPDIVDRKIEIILSAYASQAHKHWFSADTFRSTLRLRGIESGREHAFAEGFCCRKMTVGAF